MQIPNRGQKLLWLLIEGPPHLSAFLRMSMVSCKSSARWDFNVLVFQPLSNHSVCTKKHQQPRAAPTKCIAEINEALKPLSKKYLITYVKIDSSHLGDPACRRRVYFILIRRWGYWVLYQKKNILNTTVTSSTSFKLYCSCKGCSGQWHQDCKRLGAPMWNNIQESDFGPSPRNFCVRCLALWITKRLKLFMVASTLRSKLMLPEDCPYLQAVTASIESKAGKRSYEEKYDLTIKTFGCIHQTVCFQISVRLQ